MALQEITQEEVDRRLLSPSNARYVFAYDEEERENIRPPTNITSDVEEFVFYPPRNFSNYDEAHYVFSYDEEERENFRPPTNITSDVEDFVFYPPRNFSNYDETENSASGLSSSQMLLYLEHLYQRFESHFPDETEYELNSNSDDLADYFYQQEVARAENKRDGLSEEIISQFVRSRTGQDEDLLDICMVCQCEYEREEILRTLECGHEYHTSCIQRWLLEKNSCPVCKRKAVGHYQPEDEGVVRV